jgi:hypothetical protein
MTTGRRQFARVVLGALIGVGVASGAALAQETLKMGALATLEGHSRYSARTACAAWKWR